MDVYGVRRRNLSELIQDKFEGNRSSFSRAIDKNVNMINLCLTANVELRRNIGEKLAREIEERCSIPTQWLDDDRGPKGLSRATTSLPRLTAVRSASDMVTEKMAVADEWLRTVHPGRDSYASISVHSISDDTMEPTIMRGDLMLVDRDVTDGNGIFVFRESNETLVRRVHQKIGGMMGITTDNHKYPPSEVDPKAMKKVTTLGKVIGTLRYTVL